MTPPLPASSGIARADAHQQLLHTLFIELFQTERSADVHSRREAKRLGGEPPAQALCAVAAHAEGALREISALAAARGFSDTRFGVVVGSLFSSIRDLLADRLIDRERSYRGTLLGMRHGQDLMRSVRAVAESSGDTDLSAYAEGWLQARAPLVDGVAAELSWFASHPESALEGGKGTLRGILATALGVG
jgi:hypothetical protein